ncbi:hypothetical protein RJ640_029026 [Escallonia rubra]|uniref:Uncharacterized protein n=1 Tax=Escallonia rubra TaxID=112253 RepID=A0AA88S0F4_9ASTE|nr:hypothetical protein RJ640_029026 [Escallonia rubra]
MEFQNLNNSVESSVTGSREGPPMIDRGSIRLISDPWAYLRQMPLKYGIGGPPNYISLIGFILRFLIPGVKRKKPFSQPHQQP